MKSLVILMLFTGAVAPVSVPAFPLTSSVAQERAASAPLVNINTATAVELEALPGIGAATAKRILEHREKSGPFKKLEEILECAGSCPFLLRECDS